MADANPLDVIAAADAHHRRVAFCGCVEAVLQGHHVLHRSRILADAPAAGAGQVAGMEGFKLKDHRELGRLAELVLDDVAGDFLRQRKWETHKLFN
jgi:hypothetical protein